MKCYVKFWSDKSVYNKVNCFILDLLKVFLKSRLFIIVFEKL